MYCYYIMSLNRRMIEARISSKHLKYRYIKLIACTRRYFYRVLFSYKEVKQVRYSGIRRRHDIKS